MSFLRAASAPWLEIFFHSGKPAGACEATKSSPLARPSKSSDASAAPRLAFIHFCMGQDLSFEHANSFDGADGAGSEEGAAGANELMRVATAPITITEEMWSRFIWAFLGVRGTVDLWKIFDGPNQKSRPILMST